MVAASNYSSSYARALLAATSDEERLQPQKRGVPAVVTAADLALMERELKEVQQKAAVVEASYGREMLDLAIAARYVAELLGRRTIARYLDDNHPEMAKEFRSILSAILAEPSKKTSSRRKADTREDAHAT
jgi:RepB plasmid partitioning protein